MQTLSTRLLSYSLALALGMFAAACTQPDATESDLAATRKQWASHHPYAYSFTWLEGCFCDDDFTRPIRIDVVKGVASETIRGATYADDQSAVVDPVRTGLLTVEGMFGTIQSAIDDDAKRIDIVYDETRGFPTSVFINRRGVPDTEFRLTISDFLSND
jgi:hypothetical protein